jgi:hypothetical protein
MLNWEGSDGKIGMAPKFSFFNSYIHVATFPQSMEMLPGWMEERVISGNKRRILSCPKLRSEDRVRKEIRKGHFNSQLQAKSRKKKKRFHIPFLYAED